jgi:hypothetical protein
MTYSELRLIMEKVNKAQGLCLAGKPEAAQLLKTVHRACDAELAGRRGEIRNILGGKADKRVDRIGLVKPALHGFIEMLRSAAGLADRAVDAGDLPKAGLILDAVHNIPVMVVEDEWFDAPAFEKTFFEAFFLTEDGAGVKDAWQKWFSQAVENHHADLEMRGIPKPKPEPDQEAEAAQGTLRDTPSFWTRLKKMFKK